MPYLLAHGVRLGRVVYEEPADGVPEIGGGAGPGIGAHTHVFFELGDHLGSNSVVLDKATGELVERSTLQAYGGADSDYRPTRWDGFREDYRFTGKEEDVEVGLVYFGARFLAPALGRWASADPLAIQTVGRERERQVGVAEAPKGVDLNVYAYVEGQLLAATDPDGLQNTRVQIRPVRMPRLVAPPPELPEIDSRKYQRLGTFVTVRVRPTSPARLLASLPSLEPVTVRGRNAPAGGYLIAPYRSQPIPRSSPPHGRLPDGRSAVQAHHGIPSAVARFFITGYDAKDAPTILMRTPMHERTTEFFNAVRNDPGMPRNRDGTVDWSRFSWEQVKTLADEMMKAGFVEEPARREYFRQVETYRLNQEVRREVEEYQLKRSAWEIENGPKLEAPPPPNRD